MVPEPLPKKAVPSVVRCTLPLFPWTAGFFSGLLRTWQNRKGIPHLEITYGLSDAKRTHPGWQRPISTYLMQANKLNLSLED